MTNKLTYADRTQIVKDWAAQFPEMVIERKVMRIWKRLGPLLIKINVYTRSIDFPQYKPQWAIHTLYEKMPSPGSMALIYPKNSRNITWKIDRFPDYWDTMSEERKEQYKERKASLYSLFTLHYDGYLAAAEDIRKSSWISTSGTVSLDDIWQGVENYFNYSINSVGSRYFYDYEVTIPIYTAIWAGEIEKAREYIKWWEDWVNKFEEERKKIKEPNLEGLNLNMRTFTVDRSKEWGSHEDWKEQMLYYMDHPDELRQIVKDEVIAHKLEKVPYQNIVGVKYQE